MDEKKFNKKVREADEKKLQKMYFKNLDARPDYLQRAQLNTLASMIDGDAVDSMNFDYYDTATQALEKVRYQLLTGYGQCQGNLVCRGNDIVICCCRDMASLVAYRHANYYNGRIYVPGCTPEVCRDGEDTYVITGKGGRSLRCCPFCGALISERIRTKEEGKE